MEDKKKPLFVRQPEYPGGPKAMHQFIYENLRYPDAAKAAGVEGTVLVEFDIDYKGKVVETRVLQGIGHGCDEEACRVIKMLKFDVAKTRGLHVLFHRKSPIRFMKPVEKPAPLPAPQGEMQLSYTITPSAPAPVQEEPKPATGGNNYSYTITIG